MRSTSDRQRWRPSPSLAVSFVALFVALAGSALALQRNSVGPRELKPNAVRSKQVKNGQVKTRDLGRRAVKTGKLADGAVTEAKLAEGLTGAQGPAGPVGPPGPEGPPGDAATSPRAYALVTGDQVDEAHSRGITDGMVSIGGNPAAGAGVICFSGLGFEPGHVQVTVDRGESFDVIGHARLVEGTECAGDEDASVRIADPSEFEALTDADFYVAFFD